MNNLQEQGTEMVVGCDERCVRVGFDMQGDLKACHFGVRVARDRVLVLVLHLPIHQIREGKTQQLPEKELSYAKGSSSETGDVDRSPQSNRRRGKESFAVSVVNRRGSDDLFSSTRSRPIPTEYPCRRTLILESPWRALYFGDLKDCRVSGKSFSIVLCPRAAARALIVASVGDFGLSFHTVANSRFGASSPNGARRGVLGQAGVMNLKLCLTVVFVISVCDDMSYTLANKSESRRGSVQRRMLEVEEVGDEATSFRDNTFYSGDCPQSSYLCGYTTMRRQ